MTVFAAMWCYVVIGWALLEVGLRSWARPERLDGSWAWTRPAPAQHICPIGPQEYHRAGMTVPDRDQVLAVAPSGEVFWGATEDWSPSADAVAAEAGMRVLDDVDEWLAARLRDFEHELSRIGCRRVSLVKGETQRTLDDELAAFQRGSMALHAYRSMILDSTGGYGPREVLELKTRLAAC
jgi:hypothetical protein